MAYRLGNLTWDIRKALSLPPREGLRRLSGRAVRYARRLRNRRRPRELSDADLLACMTSPTASVADLVARRRRSAPLLPATLASAATAKALRDLAPATCEPILAAGRAVMDGIFDLLGSGPVRLGPIPDWHRDFKSGMRWDPGVYSLEIAPTFDRGHDYKVPWEIARLQHLPTLALASDLSGDAAFRERAISHIADFVARNPIYRGINWTCTMDVAIRASQILASEGFLRVAGDDRFWGELLKSLILHARYILDNLEDGPVRGNHYVSDLAGLYLCGLGLSEFQEARRWREVARENLLSEMRRQVTPDGLDYEASLSYHALVAEMFLLPALVESERGGTFDPPYLERLEKMIEAVAILMRPDGTLPQIGDNDDGRFLIFSQYHRPRRDWRPLLALGAYLFRRPGWLGLAGDAWVEAAWVLGEKFLIWRNSVRTPEGPRGFSSHAFPDGGLYQLGAGKIQMVVDAGGIGQNNNGAHAHNDTLGLDLHAFGREILPDRGTGIYASDLSMRNRFRSSAAHNVLQVDDEEINPFPDEPFRLIPADSPRVLRWRSRDRYAYLRAEHAGYRRLRSGVLHRRSILLDASKGAFHIEDRLLGEGYHKLRLSFHLAPGWSVATGEAGWASRSREGDLLLQFLWRRAPRTYRTRVDEDLHSPSYGRTQAARTVRIEWEADVPCRIRYDLLVQELTRTF
ncbi:MAG TPA: alginate lyase family protein [Candidatus Polarisedimenticolia bacterium]|nr:alginate lyase family protein [Candidatus Polarisedimenticolia bacterium]